MKTSYFKTFVNTYKRISLIESELLKYNKLLIKLYNSLIAFSLKAIFIIIIIMILIYLSFDIYSFITYLRKTLLTKITKTRNKLTIFKINFLNRSKRLISLDKTSDIIFVLLGLYLNSILNRYRYSNIYIRRRLSFFVDVIFILLWRTISIIIE